MIEIIEPKLVTTEVSGDKRYGKFVWEPLERGYGIRKSCMSSPRFRVSGKTWQTSS